MEKLEFIENDEVTSKKRKKNGKRTQQTFEELVDNFVTVGAITQEKADIIKHPAIKKVVVGGKSTGKTVLAQTEAFCKFETDEYFNAYGFRKYANAASDKLGRYFANIISLAKQFGIHVSKYEIVKDKAYSMLTGQKMFNPIYQFGSLEDPNSTDGTSPTNGGYFGMALIDEPVVKEDVQNPEKIPSRNKFEEDIFIIKDNIERFNDNYNRSLEQKREELAQKGTVLKAPEAVTKFWYCMNPWGSHPLILDIEKFIPEDKFFEWIFGYSKDNILEEKELIERLFENDEWVQRIIDNSILHFHDKSSDTLFIRMTKWANPGNLVAAKKEELLSDIKRYLIEGNINKLSLILGLKHEGHIDNEMKVFNIADYNNQTPLEDLLKDYYISEINYAWDIDTSRVLTCTPTLKLSHKRKDPDEGDELVYWDEQIEFKTWGTGEYGELNEIYFDRIVELTDSHYQELKYKDLIQRVLITVDDKRKLYLNEIRKRSKEYMTGFRTFQQHGTWVIETRQDLVVAGLDNKRLYIHPNNKKLVQDMKVMVKDKPEEPKRKTSGSTNYLDRYDSAENGAVTFAYVINRHRKRK